MKELHQNLSQMDDHEIRLEFDKFADLSVSGERKMSQKALEQVRGCGSVDEADKPGEQGRGADGRMGGFGGCGGGELTTSAKTNTFLKSCDQQTLQKK